MLGRGETENQSDYVTSERNLDKAKGQLVDSGGGRTKMESKSSV